MFRYSLHHVKTTIKSRPLLQQNALRAVYNLNLSSNITPSQTERYLSSYNLSAFATLDPKHKTLTLDQNNQNGLYEAENLVNGKWSASKDHDVIVDPLTGEPMISIPNTSMDEISPFVTSLAQCPKTGLHNPFKNIDRYRLYGDVCFKAAAMLREPEVLDYFVRLIQRVAPKSYAQALGEVVVTRLFFENFCGDQVRFLNRSFGVTGDHDGQVSQGYRFPYGPSVIISPFNFPMEIPTLQLLGALFMGNKVLLKGDSKVSIVMDQVVRMLHACGMPMEDVDMIHCDGPVMEKILVDANPRMTQFTGSSRIAEHLALVTRGKIKIEDAGFDWKILGHKDGLLEPEANGDMTKSTNLDYVAYVCDQDAYGFSGQKCSAQSILFIHKSLQNGGTWFEDKLKTLVSRRSLKDLTITPILTVNNDTFTQHRDAILKIPGARIGWGGKLLAEIEETKNHQIPSCYGSFQPTAIFVPLKEILKEENFNLVTREIFGPFYVYTEYDDNDLEDLYECLNRMENHLTAAVVSNDVNFQREVLGNTVNGTTYAGIRGRTTGAPQNHWFGPAGDPRGAGIGSPEAIKLVWSCHREVISDEMNVNSDWTLPKAT